MILSEVFENHQRVVEITNNSAHDVNSLFFTQEEADTRLLLLVNDSKTRYGTRIVICGHQILMCWFVGGISRGG